MKKNRIISLICTLVLLLALVSCSGGGKTQINPSSDKNPIVTMTVKGYGDIIIELYPDVAPNTVANFISLVKSGFYDNNTIHRVYTGFMLQGGDPTGTGYGDPGYSIKGEFSSNGFKNDPKHEKGVISMARATNPNSGGSQFFIMLEADPHLDGDYAAFGKVISGMEVAEAIEKDVGTRYNNGMLAKDDILTITKTTVDTKGVEYSAPETLES